MRDQSRAQSLCRIMELEPTGIIPPDDDPVLGRDPAVERVEQALGQGREQEALELADAALAGGEGSRVDLLFLSGDALLALGRAVDAEQRLRLVLDEDPGCPVARCWLAMALYRQSRFDESHAECDRALGAHQPAVDIHVVRGLLLERAGDFEAADKSFRKAAELDPMRFQSPQRLTREEFDAEVCQAVERLPLEFREHLERVPVLVQDVPAVELLRVEAGAGSDPDLLGLFCGVALPDVMEASGVGPEPNYIYLFQRNLERFALDRRDLVEQIAITLYHELGHYLGLEEEDMEELGLD